MHFLHYFIVFSLVQASVCLALTKYMREHALSPRASGGSPPKSPPHHHSGGTLWDIVQSGTKKKAATTGQTSTSHQLHDVLVHPTIHVPSSHDGHGHPTSHAASSSHVPPPHPGHTTPAQHPLRATAPRPSQAVPSHKAQHIASVSLHDAHATKISESTSSRLSHLGQSTTLTPVRPPIQGRLGQADHLMAKLPPHLQYRPRGRPPGPQREPPPARETLWKKQGGTSYRPKGTGPRFERDRARYQAKKLKAAGKHTTDEHPSHHDKHGPGGGGGRGPGSPGAGSHAVSK